MNLYIKIRILRLEHSDGCKDVSLTNETIGSHCVGDQLEVQYGAGWHFGHKKPI